MTESSIVFLATHGSGGIRELWSDLAQALRERGHRTECVGFYPPPVAEQLEGMEGWRILSRHQLKGPLSIAQLVFALFRWLRATRPKLIVTAMPAANVLVPLIARIASPRTRVAISHHSPTKTHSALLDRIDAQTGQLRNVIAVISVSDTVAASLARRPTRYLNKRRTIRNALPPRVETLADSVAAEVPRRYPPPRSMVATGRLAYQKNYPTLLRALARLDDVTLDIVGSGPDEPALRQLAEEYGITARTHFHGRRPRAETLRVLAEGGVFVQVSRFEGHSLALIEAARIGVPMIVSDVPEQIEAVTLSDGTLCAAVVGVDDDGALARAVVTLLDNPAQYRDAATRAARMAELLPFAGTVDAYESLLQDPAPVSAV